MKNILVTGGAGYIGSHIVEQLIQMKKKVFIVDNLSTGYKKLIHKKAKFFRCDIKNFKKMNNLIHKNQISTVIHLAAKLSVGESQKKPRKYYLNNVLGTKNIVKCCKQNNIKNLIFSSTCAVYKDKLKVVKESSKVNPKSVYGKTKLLSEKLIRTNLRNSKTNFAILRYFNVAGASSSGKIGQISKGDQLFKNLSLASVKIKPTINVYGNNYRTKDKTCIRDYIHVADIAKIHILVLKKINYQKKSVLLNCGYGKGISVLESIKEFEKQTKKKFKVNIKGRRKGDMEEIIADNTKIKKFIKWRPKKNSLIHIVKSCINWEKKIR
jgi:UDP-glucose 4-epimerase